MIAIDSSALNAKEERPPPLSPRESKRQALERTLGRAISGAAPDGGRTAYRLILEARDKVSTVRAGLQARERMPSAQSR
jgi:hypothetical protein